MKEVFDGKAPFEDLGRVADVHMPNLQSENTGE